MTPFRPPGTLLLAEALGKAMHLWSPEGWDRLRPEARKFFEGGVQLHGFPLISLASQAVVQEAYGRLRMLMSTGALPSRLRVPQGPPMPIAAEAWQAGGADRLADVLAGRVRLAGPESAGDVLIQAEDLEAVLMGQPVPSRRGAKPVDQEVPPAPAVDRGGARKRFDDSDLLIEAFRVLYESNVPSSRAEHGRLALEAYAERHPDADPPSAEWAKPHIQRLWKAFDLERRSGRKAG